MVFTFDLERVAVVRLGPPAADLPALLKSADASAAAEGNKGAITSVVPMYGPLGTGIALYRVTYGSTYAGGMGASSYSNDVVQSSTHLPPELAPYGRLPQWATPVVKGGTVQTVMMIAKSRLEAARVEFEAAYR
jgi:hypothetical protein